MTTKHTQTPEIAHMRDTLFIQGYLDHHFRQIEQLEDDGNPDFVEELYNMFFKDSVKYLDNIDQSIANSGNDDVLNFTYIDSEMYRFAGASASIGAGKVYDQAKLLRKCCDNQDVEGVKTTLVQVKKETAALKQRMVAFFRMIRLSGPADPAVRPEEGNADNKAKYKLEMVGDLEARK